MFFKFHQFSMLFNGKLAFYQFIMLFNRNLRLEMLGGGDVQTYGRTHGNSPLCPTGVTKRGTLAVLNFDTEDM